ncbi:protein FAR1-RELATED SEQUENCE 9-like [Cannabis sativa]|uniref:protein FAR1-RELATED SEQUENCE 9-like n=1 Tax=Cannabis sativa TaxID=3483 RepID=UPI0029CA73BC|nr:protein FAR1-RELATED SEQUENCE 9-like [Cannabis sativa]
MEAESQAENMNEEQTYEWESITTELNITKPVNEIQICDVLGKSLDKLGKWEAFYEMYAKRMGFGTRKDDVRRSHGVIVMRSGGYERMPCQLRDVYNRVAGAKREEKIETDSEGALGFLDCLAERDPNFFVVYQVDEENRLANLFWADGNSRVDYVAFGDVLGFDTTYMTNEYNKPLTVLIGVNHHFNTCIFGFALLLHEKLPSYRWLLQKFLECHGDKKPNVVVTDQDVAMKQAIMEHMPDVTHRLCAWHLNTNASKKVKDPIFLKIFKDLMYNYYEEEDFEARWLDVVETQQLTDNEWCQTTFDTRKQWAETYLRGSFVAGMRTTQRCESINSALKKFLEKNYCLREFVTTIDMTVSKLRHNETANDFKSRCTRPHPPNPTCLTTYYNQCAEFYTRTMYHKVAEQLDLENNYFVISEEQEGEWQIYTIGKFQHPEVRYRVHYCEGQRALHCSCMLYESQGYPCRHLWATMKRLNIRRIPNTLLMKRWSKSAKTNLHLHFNPPAQEQQHIYEMARFGSLSSLTYNLTFYAAKTEDSYTRAKEEIERLTLMFKEEFEMSSNPEGQTPQPGRYRNNPNIIKDPEVVRTKGTGNPREGPNGEQIPRNSRHCRICRSSGHDYRRCPNRQQNTGSQGQQSAHNQPTTDSFNEHSNAQSNINMLCALMEDNILRDVYCSLDRYSAFAENFETIVCFFDFHDMRDLPRKMQKLMIDRLVFGQVPQSALENA